MNSMNKIYALLVGINDYAPNIGKLQGCLNDVNHVKDYLIDKFDPSVLHLETLTDSDAKRGNKVMDMMPPTRYLLILLSIIMLNKSEFSEKKMLIW